MKRTNRMILMGREADIHVGNSSLETAMNRKHGVMVCERENGHEDEEAIQTQLRDVTVESHSTNKQAS